MPVYWGDYGLVNVRTDTVGVLNMPLRWTLVTGLTPPVAAPGAKNFAGIARCKADSVTKVGYDKKLQGVLAAKSTGVLELDNGRVFIDGLAACRTTATRAELSTFQPQTITYVGAGTMGAALGTGLSVTAPTHNVGDLLICVMWSGAGGHASETPGWTYESYTANNSNNQGAPVDFRIEWRVADGTGNDNMTFTLLNPNSTNPTIAQIFAYRNVDVVNGPFAWWCAQNVNRHNSWISSGTGAGTGLRTMPVALGADVTYDVGLPYGHTLWQKAHCIAFMLIGDEQLANPPTLVNNPSADLPNTADEANTFPYTIDVRTNTSLGVGASLTAWRFVNATGPEIGVYAAGGNLTINTAATVNAALHQTVLLPKNTIPNDLVFFDGLLKDKVTATCNLNRIAGVNAVNLDGVLSARSTATAGLSRQPGKFLDGILQAYSTAIATLYAPHIFDRPMLCRCVALITYLKTGTAHQPAGVLRSKATATATLTTDYMQALLACRVSIPLAIIDVAIRFAGSAAARCTVPAMPLTVGRAYAGSALVHSTATARLTTPLRGVAGCRSTGVVGLGVTRQVMGGSVSRSSASMNLSVVRMIGALLGARSTALATLTSDRAPAASARARCTASASLTSARWTGGIARCRCTASLTLHSVRPVRPPTTDITVSPYTLPVDSEFLPVAVESPSGTVYVEEA